MPREQLRKHEDYDKAGQDTDEWKAREIVKDMASQGFLPVATSECCRVAALQSLDGHTLHLFESARELNASAALIQSRAKWKISQCL
ncbi:hypothetical protein MUK42_05982 [Musa troglodytarum]|uniref:Uncharacterized protein n=1 Tax=Musa troglodytarum TaxID=320322 RepID=A0A9E7K8M1_9LILI|nr:hypothetical protein MUK42_05982 [Musa troglodytarum]